MLNLIIQIKMVLLAQGPWPFDTVVQPLNTRKLGQKASYGCIRRLDRRTASSVVSTVATGYDRGQSICRRVPANADRLDESVIPTASYRAPLPLSDVAVSANGSHQWQGSLMGPLVADAPDSFTAWIQ